MKKYAALVAVAILAAFAAPALAATNPFMDVPMNHWAYDAIGQLAATGVLSGYPDGTYKGKQPTTRYEMASALARALAVVDMTKASKQDVEMLKKLVIEFKDELDALGVKVDQIDKRLAVIEDRLGGWKLSGVMRMEFFNLSGRNNSDDDISGTEFARARLFIDRWFGEDESLHFHVRFDGRDAAYSSTSGSSTPNWTRFFVEMPVFWDMKLTVGRFLWDFEGPYYLDGATSYGTHMSAGNDAWLMDRGIDGMGLQKSFGPGNLHFYVGHPHSNFLGLNGAGAENLGTWEVFAMGQFQFTEQFAFDLGAQAFFGDDGTEFYANNLTFPQHRTGGWAPMVTTDGTTEFSFNNLYTIFAGLRFNFNDMIAFKGMYYYQDSGAEYRNATGGWSDYIDDSVSAFRAIVEVKQDMLKFTDLWLEYDQLDEGFVMPTGVASLFFNTDFGGGRGANIGGVGTDNLSLLGRNASGQIASGSMLNHDINIWRIAAQQKWNDKWSTILQYANYNVDNIVNSAGRYTDGDITQWGVGVIYKYNPNVAFGLHYSKFSFDDIFNQDDVDLIRFRTQVTF